VGIGTTSPAQKLTVQDTSNNPYLSIIGGASATLGMLLGTTGNTVAGQIIYSNSTNNMGFVTNSTEQARITSAGLLQFNSGYGSVATAFGCRAWVNFNGSGTVAIRASGNVSSITDNGTGDYTINFTTAMPDANYNAVGLTSTDSSTTGQMPCLWTIDSTQTTSAFRVRTGRASIPGVVAQGLADLININVSVFR
jgi:hypothetical protein